MDIKTKTVTTKTHTATFTAEEIKAVALIAAKRETGVGDVVSSAIDVAADGSITVELVERVEDAEKPVAEDAEKAQDAPAAAEPAAVLPAPAPVVGYVPGFGGQKAA